MNRRPGHDLQGSDANLLWWLVPMLLVLLLLAGVLALQHVQHALQDPTPADPAPSALSPEFPLPYPVEQNAGESRAVAVPSGPTPQPRTAPVLPPAIDDAAAFGDAPDDWETEALRPRPAPDVRPARAGQAG